MEWRIPSLNRLATFTYPNFNDSEQWLICVTSTAMRVKRIDISNDIGTIVWYHNSGTNGIVFPVYYWTKYTVNTTTEKFYIHGTKNYLCFCIYGTKQSVKYNWILSTYTKICEKSLSASHVHQKCRFLFKQWYNRIDFCKFRSTHMKLQMYIPNRWTIITLWTRLWCLQTWLLYTRLL